MPYPTADHSASVSFVLGTSTASAPTSDDATYRKALDEYLKASSTRRLVIDASALDRNTNITNTVAPWLGAVQRRLNASIRIDGSAEMPEGPWLSKEVVGSANVFFDATSNLLPSEPYLYGLPTGELVAEFDSNAGRMTLIVSKDTATALATVEGDVVHKSIKLVANTPAAMRSELSAVVSRLRIKQDGVEAG
jgi:hypothetical protein